MKVIHTYTGASRLVTFDFGPMAASGAILTSPAASVNPADRLTLGAPAVNGTRAQVMVSGGTDRAAYVLTMQVASDNGEVLVLKVLVDVNDSL
jgi:hypothetical protein